MGLDSTGQIGDLIEQTAALSHELADLPVGVHHRGVIATPEGLADLGQAEIGEFAAQIHRNLAGCDEHS